MSALRRLVFPHAFVAALCIGLGIANAARSTTLAVVVVALGAAGAAVAARPGVRLPLLACALLLAGWWAGSLRLESLDRSVLRAHVGESARTTAVVTGPARRGAFALRLPAQVHRFGALAVRERALLELPLGRSPPQGAVLEVIGKIVRPRTVGAGFDEESWLRRQGAHVVVQGGRWRVVGRRGGLVGAADRLRARLARTIAPGLDGEQKAVVAGVVLGEDEGLPHDLRDSFRASGLYHLLAVSGQNVALLAGGILGVAWLAGIPRWLGEIGVLAAIGGYLAAVGWQPSVVRAGVAGGLASLAWLAARPRDRWYFLLLGAAVLLAWNPYSLLEPGFQLSFAAVAAIFVAVPRVEAGLEGYPVPRVAAGIVAVSGACGVATAPILWLHFGGVPLYSVLGNALAAFVVGPLLGFGLVTAALEPILPEAALALAWVNGWLAAYLAGCARLVAGLPYAQVTSGAALALLAMVGLAAALVQRLDQRRRRSVLALAVVTFATWAAWMSLADAPARRPPTGFRLTALDVGQGDATLIEVPGGAVLVDQGPPEARVADQLVALGLRHLDLLVLTHPSRDNIGGAEDVVRRLAVGFVLDPALPFPNPFGHPALAEARRRGIRVETTRAGMRFRLGGLSIGVLWPDGTARPSDDPNDHATVLLVSYGSVDALLPADAESNVTLPLGLGSVEIIKVAHHGSADDGLPRLLAALRPRVAVVSAGAGNEYGHPAPSTLAALAAAPGVRVYRTDLDGRVTLESDGRRLEAHTER